MTRRYLIVGNGPAGLSAAEAIRQRDRAGEIVIVGDEKVGFYSRPGLAYFLAGTLPESRLFSRAEREYRRLGVRRIISRAVRLDIGEHHVSLENGRALPYDRLLLAVGARALRPALPGMDLPGVATLDNLADARAILRLAKRARRAIVVGGGITALELAEGLASRGVETHYLMRRDRYWGAVLTPDESTLIEARLAHDGVHLHRNTELRAVLSQRGRLAGVDTGDGGRIECEVLAVAIGIRPRLELAHAGGLEVGRGVATDACFQTSAPDVYAAGDAAEVLDPESGERVLDSLWSVAIEQGRAAGANMAGVEAPYSRQTPFNVTRLAGITTTLIGAVGSGSPDEDLMTITRGDSETWRRRPDAFAVEAESGPSRLRVLFGNRHILGAVVMGDQTLSRPLQRMIRGRVDARPLRERLRHEPHELARALGEWEANET